LLPIDARSKRHVTFENLNSYEKLDGKARRKMDVQEIYFDEQCSDPEFSVIPMDLSSDEVDYIEVFPEFTSEACLQRHIAFAISTIVISFLKGKEVTFTKHNMTAANAVCLPIPNYIKYDFKYAEALGDVLLPDDQSLAWVKRELFATKNTDRSYFAKCLAAKYVFKEFRQPPAPLQVRVNELKATAPVVAEIWMHFHRLLKELSSEVCDEKEWDLAVKEARRYGQAVKGDKKILNFTSTAVCDNHNQLYHYMMDLKKCEDFISCFEKVCDEWEQLKTGWHPEEVIFSAVDRITPLEI
jgi:hypothetical protein